MASPIKNSLLDEMKVAMRGQDKLRLQTIRLILAAIKQREIDSRVELSLPTVELNDDDIKTILNKMVKQRRDSVKQFMAGNRPELAEKELAEIDIIQTFLPPQLSEEAIINAVQAAINAANAASMQDMGKVMSLLQKQLEDKAEMSIVSGHVKKLLLKH